MNSEANQPGGGYVYIPEGSQVLIVRDENEGSSATQKMGSEGQTDKKKIDPRILWATFNKHKLLIIGLTLLFGSLATLMVPSFKPIYHSAALLLIELDKPNIIAIEEVAGGELTATYFQTQLKILKSRVLSEKVVEKLDLMSHPAFQPPPKENKGGWRSWLPGSLLPDPEIPPPPTFEERKKTVVEKMREGLSIGPLKDSQLVQISFESSHAPLTSTIPNTLADIYIESDLEAKLAMTNKATSWLTRRLDELRKKVTQSEQELQNYIEGQGLVDVEGVKTLAAKQIEETAGDLVKARLDLAKVENLYKQVRALRGQPPNAFESIPAILNNPLVQGVKGTELEAENKLSELSERYGPKHPKIQAAIAELKTAKANTARQIQHVVSGITNEYKLALANVKILKQAFEENKQKIQEINRKEYKIGVMKREIAVNRQLYDMFLTRFKETDASQDVQALQSTVGRIVEPALVPSKPENPNKRGQMIIMSWLLSFIFASLIAFLLEMLDNTIKINRDVEQKLGLPVLGNLPKLTINQTEQFKPRWMFLNEPQSLFSEAVRTLRTGIMLSGLDSTRKILLVTSSIPGEGKTTLAINQALALGQVEKTLLIEGDMRRPSIAKSWGLSSNAPGLSELVAETQKFDKCIYQISIKGSVDIIPCGARPPNPLELLSSSRFKEVLDQLSQEYKYIIIDSAPTTLVSDSLVLARHANEILYVIEANTTGLQIIREGLQRLRQIKGTVCHIVLNQVIEDTSAYRALAKYHKMKPKTMDNIFASSIFKYTGRKSTLNRPP